MAADGTYSVLIAEDEEPARELLLDYLLTRHELKLYGIARNGSEALKKLTADCYDLALMDIDLPILSGIEVLKRLEHTPYVIFTTAYDRYAIEAFDMGAIDYLLKPFSAKRFNQAIDKFLGWKERETAGIVPLCKEGLSIKVGGKHYLVSYNEIIYLTSQGRNTIIHTENKDFTASGLLKEYQSRLPDDYFIRIHKKHIINSRYLNGIEYFIGGQYLAFLKDHDDTLLPVGRKYAGYVKQMMRI